MKLLFCPDCYDIITLTSETRHCKCSATFGKYMSNGVHAQVSENSVVLGFNNNSFVHALKNPPHKDADRGKRFEAFIIPANDSHIIRQNVND